MENFNKYLGIYTTSGDVQTAINEGTLKKPYVALVDGIVDYNTISPEPDYSKMPLTFEITGDGYINWYASDSSYTKTIEYSKNGGEWTSITSDADTPPTISVVSGDTLQFRGDNAAYGAGDNNLDFNLFNFNSFANTTAQFKVKGNIMSLIDSTNFSTLTTLESAYTFCNLFAGCTSLTDASNLILPVTTLADGCYTSMFFYCPSLTTAPQLPATTLANGCYGGMFLSCENLAQAPELPAATLAERCYMSMFFYCTSLTTAPELPATTLANGCYGGMFQGCANLNYIKCLATDISASNCTSNWVNGVSSTGTFVKAASMNDWETGDNGIPEGWTVEEE